VPRVLVTDKLASYGPAHRVVMPSGEHRQSKYLNNRAENSHQPTRQRERAMKRFTSPQHGQLGAARVTVEDASLADAPFRVFGEALLGACRSTNRPRRRSR
jgi:hypothetical protein